MIELTTEPLPNLSIGTPKKVLTADEAPIAGTTVPYIDVTPTDRKLANQSKGAFNKKILTIRRLLMCLFQKYYTILYYTILYYTSI